MRLEETDFTAVIVINCPCMSLNTLYNTKLMTKITNSKAKLTDTFISNGIWQRRPILTPSVHKKSCTFLILTVF